MAGKAVALIELTHGSVWVALEHSLFAHEMDVKSFYPGLAALHFDEATFDLEIQVSPALNLTLLKYTGARRCNCTCTSLHNGGEVPKPVRSTFPAKPYRNG